MIKINTDNSLHSAIKKLTCFDESVKIENIEAGQSSQCFKVSTLLDNKRLKSYFVKYDTNAVFIHNEIKASMEASNIGLSPQVIYSNKNWLVSQFIEGVTLDNYDVSINQKIDIALNLIIKCDSLTTSVPVFNIEHVVNHIMLAPFFSNAQRQFIQRLLCKLPFLENKKLVTCHSDVNFSNVLLDKSKAWLIDFECACLAEKEFEIAMFFAINLLSADNQIYALNTYKKLRPMANISENKVSNYLLYSYLINGLWYLEKAQKIKGTELNNHKFYNLAFEQLSLFDSMYQSDVSLSCLMR